MSHTRLTQVATRAGVVERANTRALWQVRTEPRSATQAR
jgi:hypothetical protein